MHDGYNVLGGRHHNRDVLDLVDSPPQLRNSALANEAKRAATLLLDFIPEQADELHLHVGDAPLLLAPLGVCRRVIRPHQSHPLCHQRQH